MDNSANHRHDDASIEQLLVAPRKSTSENKASASASLPVTHDVEESEECALSPGSNDGSPDGLSNFLPVSSFLKAIQATSHAVHAVRECSHWIEYQLDENTWNLLKPRLEESVEGIRYEYFSQTQTFVHQMPSLAHDLCANMLTSSILSKLRDLCASPEERQFVSRIANRGSADVKALNTSDIHQPDSFIIHYRVPQHGLVVEISYSQKRKKLQELAEFYIRQSVLEIQMLIALDFDYGRTEKVTLLTWRRDGDQKPDPYIQDIRTEDGTLIPGPPLQIFVSDLAPRRLIPRSMHDQIMEFSVEELSAVLEIAGESQAAETQVIQARRSRTTPNPIPSHTDGDGQCLPSDEGQSSEDSDDSYASTSHRTLMV